MGNETNNLKKDFKDFIGSLSTEICKDVLKEEIDKVHAVFKSNEQKLEQKLEKKIDEMKVVHADFKQTGEKIEKMQIIHEAFKRTEENYNYLYLNNKDSLKNLREEVIKLGASTQNVKKLSDDIAQQTATVSTALKTIQCDNGKVVEDIVTNNRKLFIDCTEKIQTVNAYERERFLRELEARLNKHTNYYFEKLDETLNSDIVKDLQRSLDAIAINQEKNRKDLQTRFDTTTLRLEGGVNSNIGLLENKVKELSELTFELNQKVKIKTNILLTLNVILLSVFSILVVLLIMK